MQHRRLVLEQPHAGVEQRPRRRRARRRGRSPCRCAGRGRARARATPRSAASHERVGERRAGHEVGGGQVDRRAAPRRSPGSRAPRRWCRRPPPTSARAASARRRRSARDRAGSSSPTSTSPVASSQFSANAPCRPRTTGPWTRTWVSRQWSGSCGVAGPLLGDADAAGHPDPAVGDEHAAVGAVGEPRDRVGLRRAEADTRTPASRIALDQRAVHLHRAERVEDHLAARPRPSPARRSPRRPRRRCRRASRRRSGR